MSWKDELLDSPERRAVAQAFEVRSAGNNIAKITGYASVFDRGYDVHGGPSNGVGWTEIVSRSAFKRTLTENPHVHLLINHAQDGGLPLASTKSGTLRLSTDSMGLIAESEVDRRNSRANDLVLTLDRGDADEMSFAFRVKAQSWSDDESNRSLDEVSLHKGDVSVVGFGANPHTSVGLRNAVQMLARQDFSDKEFAELRAMGEQVDRAMTMLKQARADKEPYGDVAYADPKNGKYPIDTKEHVKAAWSYINMPKNQEGYTAAELVEIKARIRVAAKKFGIEISDDESNSRALAPNIIAGDQATFARQVHDMATAGGASCATSRAADGAGLEDGDVFDDDYDGPRDSLEQAVHDLVSDAAGACDEGFDDLGDEGDDSNYDSLRTLTVADVARAVAHPDNLTLAEAARMCLPEDSPEPLSLADAERLAS